MSQVLVYSRAADQPINTALEILCAKLSEMGHHTEQTHSTNWARIFLNDYDLIHLFVEQLPLSVNELFFISLAKTLGKPIILSLFNSDTKMTKPIAAMVCPDVLTVSQTNYFQFYRDWNCSKSVLPLIPSLSSTTPHLKKPSVRPFLIPIEKSLNEVFQYETAHETFFDARPLLKSHSSSLLRKTWNQFLQNKKIEAHYHLILSEEKVSELLLQGNLQIILANPILKHTEFTAWVEKSLNRGHCIFLNDFQATGFSHAWRSGVNCQVLSPTRWPQSFNLMASLPQNNSDIKSKFKLFELIEPLINETSRLYTKLIRQNAVLISSHSANIKS